MRLFVALIVLSFVMIAPQPVSAQTPGAQSPDTPRKTTAPASPETPQTSPSKAQTKAPESESSSSPAPALQGEVVIPSEYLEEMQTFYGECMQSSVTATYYDCRCLAVKYLDKRIERGRYYEQQELMNEIRKECSNPTEIAGYSYGVCTKQLTLMDRTENLDAYCSCFANAFAKAYQQNPKLGSRYIQILQREAYSKCSKERRD